MTSLSIDENVISENKEDIKKKLTVKEYHLKIFELLSNLDENDKELKNLELEFLENKKKLLLEKKKVKRELNLIEKKLPKLFDNEINKARKQKRNNNGNNKGGIMKPCKVPKKLRIYLDLKEDELLPRVKVCKLLNAKLSNDGLRDKKVIKLNKKVGKVLGYKKGYEIEFKKFQTWLKEFYNNDEEINNSKNIDV